MRPGRQRTPPPQRDLRQALLGLRIEEHDFRHVGREFGLFPGGPGLRRMQPAGDGLAVAADEHQRIGSGRRHHGYPRPATGLVLPFGARADPIRVSWGAGGATNAGRPTSRMSRAASGSLQCIRATCCSRTSSSRWGFPVSRGQEHERFATANRLDMSRWGGRVVGHGATPRASVSPNRGMGSATRTLHA